MLRRHLDHLVGASDLLHHLLGGCHHLGIALDFLGLGRNKFNRALQVTRGIGHRNLRVTRRAECEQTPQEQAAPAHQRCSRR